MKYWPNHLTNVEGSSNLLNDYIFLIVLYSFLAKHKRILAINQDYVFCIKQTLNKDDCLYERDYVFIMDTTDIDEK